MSAAAPTANAGTAAPAKKGKKKLIVIVVALLLVLGIGAGAALFLLKKKPVDDEAGDEAVAQASQKHSAKPDLKHPPTFLPLDPFVVNLADKESDRYAQIGITLEVDDPKLAEQLKLFMPAIRNGILMILAHKSSSELLQRAGKEQLAGEIQREAARSIGIEVAEPEPVVEKKADDEDPKPKKKKKRAPVEPNPIKQVHFSNFIVQ